MIDEAMRLGDGSGATLSPDWTPESLTTQRGLSQQSLDNIGIIDQYDMNNLFGSLT